eukprot:SM000813S22702  [mRNA]  locus=s813:1:2253:- [translate_table: standard]
MTTAVMRYDNVVPASASGAIGYVDVNFGETKLCWTLVLPTGQAIEFPSKLELRSCLTFGASLGSGATDVDGPVVFTMYDTDSRANLARANGVVQVFNKTQSADGVNVNRAGACYFGAAITQPIVDMVLNGPSDFYVLYSTQTYPAGECSGRLVAERKYQARLEATAGSLKGGGFAEVTFSQNQVCWAITLDDPSADFSAASIHAGGASNDGPEYVKLGPALAGCAAVNLTAYYELRSNPSRFYVLLASATVPAVSAPTGFARGQLGDKVALEAALGGATASLTLGNGGIRYSVTGSALPSQAYVLEVHRAADGSVAASVPLLDLYDSGAPLSTGFVTVYDQSLLSDIMTSPASFIADIHDLQNNKVQAPLSFANTVSTLSPPPAGPPPPPPLSPPPPSP